MRGQQHVQSNMRILSEGMRGDIKKMIDILSGQGVAFHHCGRRLENPNEDYPTAGYRHENGVEDKDGETYWIVTTCPDCGYQYSLNNTGRFENLNYDISLFFNE